MKKTRAFPLPLIIFLSALLCLASYFPVFGQAAAGNGPLPEGAKGRHIQALLDIFNAPDLSGMEVFVRDHVSGSLLQGYTLASLTAEMARWRCLAGKVEFLGLRSGAPAPPGITLALVKAAGFKGPWMFVLRFDASPEEKMDSYDFQPARPPTGGPPSADRLTLADFRREMASLARKLQDCGVFSGSCLVARKEEVLFTYACGESNKADHVANRLDTKFNLGSMNKMFTATAIAQLVEKGKVSLSDTLDRYLDETWLPGEITSKVTIEQLLTHRSGLGSYFNKTFIDSSRDLYRELADYKPLLKEEKLAFEPGTRFLYSNTGFLLLGAVVEKASGQNYFEYIRQHVYEPAGMKDSDCYELDLPIENLAQGYIPDLSTPYGWRSNIFLHVKRGGPAGGGYSTSPDLHRFALALLGNKLVSAETLQKLWTDHHGDRYGFGFGVSTGPAGREVGHSGGFGGLNSKLTIYPDKGYIVCVMSNYDQGAELLAALAGDLVARLDF